MRRTISLEKRKFKTEVEVFSAHVAAWLVKMHRNFILFKLDLGMQEVAKTVA